MNWFLRSIRKNARGETVTPRGMFFRHILAMLGPTWVASPWRRLVQVLSFLVFLWLFLYVCWPYTAEKAKTWPGWIPVAVDADTGRVTLATENAPLEPLAEDMLLFAVDTSLPADNDFDAFRIRQLADTEIVLTPDKPLAAEQIEKISMSVGPWSLYEKPPGSWPSHYADDLTAKEILPAESFLAIDPLVSISTALSSKTWVWSLACSGVILAICLIIPRGFCGYVCPLGTLLDLFDWAIGGRVRWFRVPGDGWWVHIKYYLLLGVLLAALCGVTISGYVAAIPVITRGLVFLASPLQTAAERGWHQVPPMNAGQWVSIALFAIVLGLGLLRPRFWCKYVCPTGAIFSTANWFRLFGRKVESSCVHCTQCVKICPFDAIKPDFTTRGTDCTFCQTCGGACPPGAIRFTTRWNRTDSKDPNDPPTGETALGRRGFLAATIGTIAAVTGGLGAMLAIKGSRPDSTQAADAMLPIRPPGSVPEPLFLQMCIRCGECLQACPNNVLQPSGLDRPVDQLWTPRAVADWSGCEPSCNNCGQVCPTGAIRALPLAEKRAARMGLAVINEKTCLPYAGREECQLCVDECVVAGYNAIEFTRIGTQVDEFGNPIEDTGFLSPVILADKCIGCGLCQTRCYNINAIEKGLLTETAILVEAGAGKEDRLTTGSYVALREAERKKREAEQQKLQPETGGDDSYLPDFLN